MEWQITCDNKCMKNKVTKKKKATDAEIHESVSVGEWRPGAASGGQSGDTQGLSDVAEADPESVAELIEEGQSYEAEVIKGVQDAPDADEGGVHTHQVPEDDVPWENEKKEQD